MYNKTKVIDNLLCSLVYTAYFTVITVMVGLTCWVGLTFLRGILIVII